MHGRWNRRPSIPAIEAGLRTYLSYITQASSASLSVPVRQSIQAADLTARVVTGATFDAVEAIVDAAQAAGCRPILLKGGATALRSYPEPHQRTMGDIDVLVSPDELRALEAELRRLGFAQTSDIPESRYALHHHSKPFFHPGRSVWVEVHSRPFPPRSPVWQDPRYSFDAMSSHLAPLVVGDCSVDVLDHHWQLIYVAIRWAEMLHAERGAFPLLDAALLIRLHGHELDWDRICDTVQGSWAIAALRLMLSYLQRWRMAVIPASVLPRLATRDPFGSAVSIWVLHRLVTAFVLGRREPGALLTRRVVRTTWSTLVDATSPRESSPPWS